MLIRVRCKAGNFRYELEPSSTVSDLVSKIVESVNADPSSIALSNQPRGGEKRVNELRNRTLESLGLKHGDLLFVTYRDAVSEPTDISSVPAGEPTPTTLRPPADATHRLWELVKEDPVDEYWRRQDGKIKRSRDPRLCKHGANAMCDHCMPLEPYDPAYHAEQGIKRLSYHAYLRKLSPQKPTVSSASASLPPLEPLSYKVKIPCPKGNHAPWPAGICSSCQPSAITLQPQPFRMVDHLEFSTHEIVDRFLDVWRRTGTQRFGWLIGHYEPYDKVPMGIKAVVEAIHEPPQEGELDGLTLGLPWEEEGAIRALASAANPSLTFVGYIFTDLDPQEDDRTKMVYKRHPYSYYLSSLEVIFAARLQLQNPTASRSSTAGKFSSRLVTAVATGTEEGGIDISAYQISEQACAMVDADMIEASVDPGIVRVKEEDRTAGSARYIPDVFFRYKNEYGLDVQKSAKPCFPVEYLLINVTHGFPQNPSPLFLSNKFPIENRLGVESQEVQKVLRDLAKLRAPEVTSDPNFVRKEPGLFGQIVEHLSDWHLVTFLGTTGLISVNDMKLLVRAASSAGSEDQQVFYELFRTSSWETLMTFARENAPSLPDASNQQTVLDEDIREQIAAMEAQSTGVETGMGVGGTSASASVRVCPHCTYENGHGGSDCEVCGLPLG
ncbi:NPL4 [Sanghuangporus sanghuang]